MDEFTFIISYFSQPMMLQRHIQEWGSYPATISIIVVDDGSPLPAFPVVSAHLPMRMLPQIRLYRILQNVPWARSTARNLALQEAKTAWCVVTDIDHVLPVACAERLLQFTPQPGQWYRFPRYRRGRADATRNKDALPREAPWGKVHPHIDSFLIERGLYWDTGGYDQRYNGVLGGGSDFLHRLSHRQQSAMLPDDIFLEVYTRDVIPDASVTGLSRAPEAYTQRRREIERAGPCLQPAVCLPWEQVL